MVARRRYVPVKTRTESREAPERGRYMRLARLVNPRRSAPRVDKVDEVSSGLCPPAAIHRGITSGEHLFHPRTAIPRALTPPPSVACLCGRRRPPVGNSVLIELIERRGRSERCGAVETGQDGALWALDSSSGGGRTPCRRAKRGSTRRETHWGVEPHHLQPGWRWDTGRGFGICENRATFAMPKSPHVKIGQCACASG